jgi:hypothetical protein
MDSKAKDLVGLAVVSAGGGILVLSYSIIKHIPRPSDSEIRNLRPDAIRALVDWNWTVNYTMLPLLGVGYLIIAFVLTYHLLRSKS